MSPWLPSTTTRVILLPIFLPNKIYRHFFIKFHIILSIFGYKYSLWAQNKESNKIPSKDLQMLVSVQTGEVIFPFE